MFENIPNWAIIFYVSGYILLIPFGFLTLFFFRVKKNLKIGYLVGILMYLISLVIIAVLVFSLPLEDFILQAFILFFVISTSPLVGSGIYFLWHGITRKGMDKKDEKE